MMNEQQFGRMIEKQKKFVNRIEPYIFDCIEEVKVRGYETYEKLDSPPGAEKYGPLMKSGDQWGDNKKYCWFTTEYTVPKKLEGKDLYFRPQYNGYEALLFVDGVPYTNFASKYNVGSHGNHHCKVFCHNAKGGTCLKLDLEAYAGHNIEGCDPYCEPETRSFPITIGKFEICVRNEIYYKFYYDYLALKDLYDTVGRNDFRGAKAEQCFLKLHNILMYSDRDISKKSLDECIKKAIEIMASMFEKNNTETSRGKVGLLGHSHMDTAWLWEIDETVKKCARTFSNQLSLMERYEDYHFIQSSSYHLKMIETHYPQLFEKISKRIQEGRYEPNGGSWIECDCNITGGEALIRQFLWGQNYTKKHFGYLSNAFYLPDTFGYSASIPQILKGVGIDYFLTTKLSWNDTNRFPYDTYYWEGIDGSRVFVHHNLTHCWPNPQTVIGAVNGLSQKNVNDKRLVTFGYGDGGGGPEDAMLEEEKRVRKISGMPQIEDTTVGEFMKELESTSFNPNTYRGELYLELHRGTLTNQHTIKRNNRKAEIALRNAEYLTVSDAVKNKVPASAEKLNPYVETLLVNQFHDILPGTCIHEAHERSKKETANIIKDVNEIISELLQGENSKKVTVTNTLSFGRDDIIKIDTDQYIEADCSQQFINLFDGSRQLHISGLHLDGFESKTFAFTDRHTVKKSPFTYRDKVLYTPFAVVTFDENGGISSFVDQSIKRELRGNGLPLNTFLFGEDMPLAWDAWDIDADIKYKLKPCMSLISFDVVSDGETEFRIRTVYRLSEKSKLYQDIVFFADSPRVDFETIVDWNDPHRLLKTVFDVSVRSDYAIHEIQYGNVKRTTKNNTSVEQAAFEVCNHKYTDISEPNYGVALLNDCKYGISVSDSNLALTLHKGGCKPDPNGDFGVHEFVYSFLPHNHGFCAEDTVNQGYMLNYPVLVSKGERKTQKLFELDNTSVIAEAIKPCEDAQKAFIVRLYESEGTYANVSVKPCNDIKSMKICDMLENEQNDTDGQLTFKPFEIKTIKMYY